MCVLVVAPYPGLLTQAWFEVCQGEGIITTTVASYDTKHDCHSMTPELDTMYNHYLLAILLQFSELSCFLFLFQNLLSAQQTLPHLHNHSLC